MGRAWKKTVSGKALGEEGAGVQRTSPLWDENPGIASAHRLRATRMAQQGPVWGARITTNEILGWMDSPDSVGHGKAMRRWQGREQAIWREIQVHTWSYSQLAPSGGFEPGSKGEIGFLFFF